MLGYQTNIEKNEKQTKITAPLSSNTSLSQLMVMSLKPHENINIETDHFTEQFIQFEQGNGIAKLFREQCELKDEIAIIFLAGSKRKNQ